MKETRKMVAPAGFMELSEAEKDLIHEALTCLRDLAELVDAETADIDALIARFAS